MLPKTSKTQSWTLTSYKLQDAYTDFVLSRQAMRARKATLEFYSYTTRIFLRWIEAQSVTEPAEVTGRHIRAYLAELVVRGLSEWTVNGHARAIKTLLIFWQAEGYIPTIIKFEMPKVSKKRMTVLTADEVGKILKESNIREKAVLMLFVDTGIRRAEALALNWEDIDIESGLIKIIRGKGGKARNVVICPTTRRALLSYRRTLTNIEGKEPVIQTDEGRRMTGNGMHTFFRRWSDAIGIEFTPHALRRTFTILSIRAGMPLLHLQMLLGHASLEMVQYYAQMIDDDILQAHQEHSPIESLSKLKRL